MDLDAIKERAEAATPGPLYSMYGGEPNLVGGQRGEKTDLLAQFYGPSHDGRCPDADFFAHAREDVLGLIGIIEQHELCHDLHGKVNAEDFAKGCEAEQRRIYDCAPHADEVERLRKLLRRAMLIISDAIMHGMPITEEVAAVRNAIVCEEKIKGD